MVSLPGLYVCWVMSFESAELDAVDWPEIAGCGERQSQMLAVAAMVRTMCRLLNMGFSSSVRHAHGSKPCLMHSRQLYGYWFTKHRYFRMLAIAIAYGRLEPRNLARKRTDISYWRAERNGVHCSSVKPSNTNPGLTTQETSASPPAGTVRAARRQAGTTACPDTVTSA